MICEERETNKLKNSGITKSITTFSKLSSKINCVINEELPHLKNNNLLKELVLYHCTKC